MTFQPAKVLFDAERLKTRPSGLQHFCESLFKGLLSQRKDMVLYAPESIDGTRYHRPYFWHKVFNPLPRRFSLVHITHQAQSYLPQKFGGKRLLTIHDLNYLHLSTVSTHRRNRFVEIVRKNIEQSDHLVCISQSTKEDLFNHIELFPGLKDRPCSVIHNGLHLTDPDTISLKDLPNALIGKEYLLNIGQALEKKNQLSLVYALPFLSQSLVCVVHDINAPYAKKLREEAEKLKVSNRLFLYERISNRTKQALLKYCQVLVHPSYAEGFGYPPVEAMVYGKPIVLSKYGSLPEIGGEISFFLDNFSPEHIALQCQVALANPFPSTVVKERACKFSIESMANKYSLLYDQLLGSR